MKLYCEELVDEGLRIKSYGDVYQYLDDHLEENKFKAYNNLYVTPDVNFDDKIAEYISKNIKAKNVFVASYFYDFFNDKEKIQNILNGLKLLENNGFNIEIHERGVSHSIEDVKNTIKQLDEVCKLINSFKDQNGEDLSETEKFLCAYAYVRKRLKYKEEGKNDDPMESRTCVGSMNSKLVVCVGFAAILKELCARLGISIKETGATTYPTLSKLDNHEICVLNIHDSKCGIKGTYYSDPTNEPTKNALIRSKQMLPKYLMRTSNLEYEEVTPPVEDYNKYVTSVTQATDFSELSELHLKITKHIIKSKITCYVGCFKDPIRLNYTKVDEGVREIFDKYPRNKSIVSALLVKNELKQYFKDFENVKKCILLTTEREFELDSKLVALDDADKIDLSKILNNISNEDLKKIKEIATTHRRIYSLKKGSVEEMQESAISV